MGKLLGNSSLFAFFADGNCQGIDGQVGITLDAAVGGAFELLAEHMAACDFDEALLVL